ncbi:hypothetical protein ETH_00030655 [Eimeria tenella]|uniref:Uncharacterized protein n=1 Tax=Eimeria tenella TaxID=5802 RepID=U6L4R7_EIMTE|nr:hypothetical protein ETH_00030655 [Eimeria tenella]CDJ43584.1 hypothetical protein ETH_00030655 [Eimeria tenella]|eukprot:XP_013234334.1 hypothetical protein ETH_00030655 [Eimeria tenella]
MAAIENVIGGSGELSATSPILPEDCSTMQAFLMRTQRRYTQMGLETSEWANTLFDHFVAERGVGIAPDELADFYCTRLPTDLHLLITNNGLVKNTSSEQAATAAPRLYEPKQTVLELREKASRAVRAGTEANETQQRQENGARPGGNSGNCCECQGRGQPARLCPSKGERTKRPRETCKKCGCVGHYARYVLHTLRPCRAGKQEQYATYPS